MVQDMDVEKCLAPQNLAKIESIIGTLGLITCPCVRCTWLAIYVHSRAGASRNSGLQIIGGPLDNPEVVGDCQIFLWLNNEIQSAKICEIFWHFGRAFYSQRQSILSMTVALCANQVEPRR